MAMLCRVLGRTEVEIDGARIELGGPTARRVLTALVAAAGEPIGDDGLAEAVWGASVPPSSATTLQVYVSRLRQTLGDRHRGLVERTKSGYALRLPTGSTDIAQFSAQVERGRQLLAAGKPTVALRVLGEALRFWRGEPFADLASPDLVAPLRVELAELRDVAIDELAAARLAVDDAARAVSDLSAAITETPFREHRWGLLILGLYRTGRQADALSALRGVRTSLSEELGIDPGPGLQELELRVLTQDPHLLLEGRSGQTPLSATAAGKPSRQPTGARTSAGPSIGRPLSSFFGRDRELATVARSLDMHRLVLLTGPAGVGKTRLVVEHLTGDEATYSTDGGGPWFVRLADIPHPEMLTQSLIDALGLTPMTDDPDIALTRALTANPGLLVLDNCEHLTDAVAEVVLRLLHHCPRLRILATSREPLGIDGERIVTVEPLPVLEADGTDGPAMRLLFDRIRAVRPGWVPTPEERGHAHALCTSLDGLPLPLELVAARTRVLGLDEIARRIDDRFTLLDTIPRGSLTSHRTLHAAVSWSVDQLPDSDRALLFRLWPFEGGFSLEAAEAVRPSQTPTLRSLSSLVSRSLVIADTTTNPTRYRLLETLRAFCRAADPTPDPTRDAHANWIRALAEHCAAELATRRSRHAVDTLRRELPNLRAGLARDLAQSPEAALRTAGILHWFWFRDGHLTEARQLLDTALAAAPNASTFTRGRAKLTQLALSSSVENLDHQLRGYAEVTALATASTDLDHQHLHAWALTHKALAYLHGGVPGQAKRVADDAHELSKAIGDEYAALSAHVVAGAALVLQDKPHDGEAILAAAAAEAARLDYFFLAGYAKLYLGWAIIRRAPTSNPADRGGQALANLREAFEFLDRDGDRTLSLSVLFTAAAALLLTGRAAQGVDLKAAVYRYAKRRGLPALYLPFLPALIGDNFLGQPIPDPAQSAEADADGALLTWADMVALLMEPCPT